jgi:hypothetical protein
MITLMFAIAPSRRKRWQSLDIKKFVVLILAFTFALGVLPAQALGKGTFYLQLQLGCYSANKAPTKSSKWSDTNYKTLYMTSCTSAHHYEVFYTGKLKAKDLSSEAAKKEAGSACDKAALNTLLGQKDLPSTLTYGYFYPDPGAEEKKYGKRIVCFFRVADPKDDKLTLSIKRTFREVTYI